ncbi:MAG: MBL fold metallo-hydrolase [Thiohalomonadales bacterium]
MAIPTTLAFADDQVEGDFSVMVLGSGGPVTTPAARASAGYLIFIEGKPRILMDAGGGTFQRLAVSGINIKDLDVILLSHLHIDHTGDLSPIIKSMYFQNRAYNLANSTFPPGRIAPFAVYGPGANGIGFPPVLEDANKGTAQYPATSEYVDGHYDVNIGVERYLNIFTRAISAGIFNYTTQDISPNWLTYNPVTIYDQAGLVIKAVGVDHGPVPALAFRIEYKGKSIAYSGDTASRNTDPNGDPLPNGGNMVSISTNADLLIYDTALPTDTSPGPASNIFYALHTTPSRIGAVAKAADVKKLVLSHITPSTEGKSDQIKALIRAQGYDGKIKTAKDLTVYNLLKN